jgi:hypothetical protein
MATVAAGPGRRKAASARTRYRKGKAMMASTPRMMAASIQRPPRAAAEPTAIPRVRAITMASTPTASEILAP